jgi:hypothetical protein
VDIIQTQTGQESGKGILEKTQFSLSLHRVIRAIRQPRSSSHFYSSVCGAHHWIASDERFGSDSIRTEARDFVFARFLHATVATSLENALRSA